MAHQRASRERLQGTLRHFSDLATGASAAGELSFAETLTLREALASAYAERQRLAAQAAADAYCNAALERALEAADAPLQAALRGVDAAAAQQRQALLASAAGVRSDLRKLGAAQQRAELTRALPLRL